MSSYRQILYHIIFSTKNRKKTLNISKKEILLKYIYGISKNLNSMIYEANLMEDHIHILSSLHATICLSDYVKTIKTSTNKFIKENKIFPYFSNWQIGYGAFTVSWKERNKLVKYIRNQQKHHNTIDFAKEYKMFLKKYGIEYDDKYLY